MSIEEVIVKKKGTKKPFSFTDEMLEEFKTIAPVLKTNKALAQYYGVCEDTIERAMKRDERAKRVWTQAKRKLLIDIMSEGYRIALDRTHHHQHRMIMWIAENVHHIKYNPLDITSSDDSFKGISIAFEKPAEKEIIEVSEDA
jgi:hypothetical protein